MSRFTLLLLLLVAPLSACPGPAEDTGPHLPASALPDTTVGAPYRVVLAASGGTAPLRYGVDAVPPGFSFYLDSATLVGPATQAGDFTVELRVEDAAGKQDVRRYALRVHPAAGAEGSVVTAANWNVEWFGGDTGSNPISPSEDPGPRDEALQLQNVADVMSRTGADIWGLAEVVDVSTFTRLVAALPGYAGLLATDAAKVEGASAYTWVQKLALVYRTDVVTVTRAQLILTESAYVFGDRPPLRADLRLTLPSGAQDVTVIVLHMKAMDDQASYDRRQRAGQALKAYLDAQLPAAQVLVLGDWNDDLDASITTPLPSPYQAFLDDTAHYRFLTRELAFAGVGTTASYSSTIDHQLATDELLPSVVSGSSVVLRPDTWSPSVASYSSTTSDHYPVLSRFSFGGPPPRSVRVLAPEGGGTVRGGSTLDIRWEARGMARVKVEARVGTGAWLLVADPVSASDGTRTWGVPDRMLGPLKVRVSDVDDPLVSDANDVSPCLLPSQPHVVLNELLPQPAPVSGSTTPDYDRQFAELVNTSSAAVDLSGWMLHDDKSLKGLKPVRHTFAAGTVVAPGKALVVVSGATALPAGATDVVVANGAEGGLRLDRGQNQGGTGDTLYLVDPSGQVTDSLGYTDAFTDVSWNRTPDAQDACNAPVRHDVLVPGRLSSMRTRADGSAY